MSPERWQQIERLYYATLERQPDEREAFLESGCAGDESLRREVASLVAAGGRIGSFMEPSHDAAALGTPPSMIGQTLGHYRIVSLLGRGGMGEVYLGEDTTLGRTVAVKLLPAPFTSDRDRLRRFEQEARAASALNHPNIITIHEIGRVNGTHYLVTEYIEGETLRQRTEREPLTLSGALDVAVQVAGALAAAHAAGITHNDIKPENVMVRPDGLVKVLDFGLAKLAEPSSTALESIPESGIQTQAPTSGRLSGGAGMVIGTVGYMSPEQVRGERVNAPSDIFSFGCVLYEIVTGQRAFARQTAAETMEAILRDEPPEIAETDKQLPHELEGLIQQCLKKNPAERFQSARDLSVALRGMTSVSSLIQSVAPPAKAHVRAPIWIVAAVLVLLLGVVMYLFAGRGKTIDSLAVLPFASASDNPDAEYLSNGIAEGINLRLSQLPRLRVMASSTVFQYKGLDPRKAGQDLRVDAVLTGNLIQRGEMLILNTELVRVADGSQVWGEEYQRKFSDIVALPEEIAKQISETLRLKLTGEEEKRLTKHYTENAEAWQSYARGRYYWNKRTPESLNKSIEHYQHAIDKDPNYALAYAGLADSHSLLGSTVGGLSPKESFLDAKAAARTALEIDDTLAEAHAALALVSMRYDWDWPATEREIKRAIELDPNYPTTYQWYANYLVIMGRVDEAIAEEKRAQELDPVSLNINTVLARRFFDARQYDQAIEQCLKTLEMDPNFAQANFTLGQAYEQKARYEEAIAALKKATSISPRNPFFISALGHAYAVSGQTNEAIKTLDQLNQLSKRRYVSSHEMAIIYAGMGQKERAFASLEKAFADRSWRLPFLKVEPRFNNLHSDPRFADLVRRVGLPQ